MSEKVTQDLTGGDGHSFEERVMARFDAMDMRFTAIDVRFNEIDVRLNGMDSRFNKMDGRFDAIDSSLQDVNTRLEKLEARSYDTKPIWEQALKEIADTRREMSKRFDRIDAIVHENRADIRDAEDRIEKLEQKPTR
jgi:chromosome segregation ATPase